MSMADKEVRGILDGDESAGTGVSHLKRVAAINYLTDGEDVSYQHIDLLFGFEIKQISDFGKLDGGVFK